MEHSLNEDLPNENSMDLVGAPFTVIESDPGVFTMLLRKLGIHGLEVVELYDIEAWAIDHLNPHGLIFCHLCADEHDADEEEVSDDCDPPDPDAKDIWFANQLSDDACASQAVLNIIFNCRGVQLDPHIRRFYEDTQKMSSVIKGLATTNHAFIREAQNSLARPADLFAARHAMASKIVKDMKQISANTSTPASKKLTTSKAKAKRGKRQQTKGEDRQDTYHFVGYVPSGGKVWELDGLRISGPLEVGEIPDVSSPDLRKGWLDVVRPALKLRMQKHLSGDAREHIRYNLLAIVDDQYTKLSDSLELLKRERIALERRLNEQHPGAWVDKANGGLQATADEVFQTSVQGARPGLTFSRDFGSKKMDKELSILDMPERNLLPAWEACVQSAMSVKVSIEDELNKSKDMNTEHTQRTFDYDPFIRNFIGRLQQEGLLQSVLLSKKSSNGAEQQRERKGKPRPKKKTRR